MPDQRFLPKGHRYADLLDGIATAPHQAGPRLSAEQVVEIAGDQPEYNGQFRVCCATTDDHVHYAVTVRLCRRRPARDQPLGQGRALGWEKAVLGDSRRPTAAKIRSRRRTCC